MNRMVLTNKLILITQGLPHHIVNRLKDDLTILDEEGDIIFRYYKEDGNKLIVPRGFHSHMCHTLRQNQIQFETIKNLVKLNEIPLVFKGKLFEDQVVVIKNCMAHTFGVIDSATGGGKTILALFLMARRKQPTLIIVHSKLLMYQWKKSILEFLDISEDKIGMIGDGMIEYEGKQIVVAIVNSLVDRCDDLKKQFGFLIVDEVHKLPGHMFSTVIAQFATHYMLGLSATPYRRDNLTQVIYYYCGPLLYSLTPQALQKYKRLIKPTVIIRQTEFAGFYDGDYNNLVKRLISNHDRNVLIVQDIIAHAEKHDGVILVLTDRVKHLELLQNLIQAFNPYLSTQILTGSVKKAQRVGIVQSINEKKIQVVLATSKIIGEGFDAKTLNCLFLAMPISYEGRLIQYVGRIVRVDEGKKEAFVYDYKDKTGVLYGMFRKRIACYRDELGAGIVRR